MFGFDTDTVHRIRACFAQFPQIHRVLLYGSRAMGTQHPGSDVDITLIGKKLNRKNTLLPLREALDELLLPVTFDTSIFTQHENPELIRHILERGVCFYVAKPRLRVEWEMKKLKDVCEKTRNIKWASHTGQSFKYIDLSSVSRDTLRVTDTESINSENAPSRAKKIIERGDVIYATTRPTLTRTTIINNIYDGQICSTGFAVIRGKKKAVSSKYVFYFFQTPEFYARMESLQRGASYPAVTEQDVKEAPIPVPPFPEQEAIVAILDQAFAAIDQAKAKLERNIANAKELFQSKLNAIFSQKGEGWVETTLGEVTGGISTGPFGSLLHKSDYVQNGIPLINPAHITETGIKPDPQKTVTIETAERLRNYKLVKGDIIIGRRGEMGRCAIVTENEEGWLCGTGSFTIKSSKKIESEYLVRLLRSDVIREKLEFIAGGAVMKNLNNKSLSNFVIKIPSISAQKIAISQFNSLCSASRQLEALYILKITMLDELKKSILQKAFSGQLTTSEELSA